MSHTAAVDAHVSGLVAPAIKEWLADRIDEAELKRRKATARAQAEAGHGPLDKLNRAAAAWSAAVDARVAYDRGRGAVVAAEDAAEAALEALLDQPAPVEGAAGPSGV